MSILYVVLLGLVAGALARLLVPGRDPMGWLATTGLGIVGALVGKVLSNWFGGGGNVGLLSVVVGSIIVLAVWRLVRDSDSV